jgi:putative membrane protein
MIIPATPGVTRIVTEVWRPLTVLFVWDVVVTITYFFLPFKAPSLPLTIFGSALALFLGFRDTAAYARWWEGRVLWGQMINASRSLARAALAFIDDTNPTAREIRRDIVVRQIAYVHALRAALRRQNDCPDLERLLSDDEVNLVKQRRNVPNAIHDGTGYLVAHAQRTGQIDTIQQAQIEAVLVDISNAQGGMERLKNTPLPSQYRFFPALFTRVFCILLPIGLVETLGVYTPIGSTIAGLMFLAILQIGDDLVDPFANSVHDVPLTSMCRTIEIDLLQALGEPAPEPLAEVKGVLW